MTTETAGKTATARPARAAARPGRRALTGAFTGLSHLALVVWALLVLFVGSG